MMIGLGLFGLWLVLAAVALLSRRVEITRETPAPT
jgi:hypothetical protein